MICLELIIIMYLVIKEVVDLLINLFRKNHHNVSGIQWIGHSISQSINQSICLVFIIISGILTASPGGRCRESVWCQGGHGHMDPADELSCCQGYSGQWKGQSSTEAVPAKSLCPRPSKIHLSIWVSVNWGWFIIEQCRLSRFLPLILSLSVSPCLSLFLSYFLSYLSLFNIFLFLCLSLFCLSLSLIYFEFMNF